ncbi:hypothetical protein JTE90_017170 [Oedothorax gibbosus]|uniref:Large ribosomal subunit protein mL49 n=1 Tax=Oedothorax gibbosus TaxID=931172 RepID=A0AAV6VA46_9ARAC|nr:hypothetical protein JTE90_017170 [Oedothorax gibbosus]
MNKLLRCTRQYCTKPKKIVYDYYKAKSVPQDIWAETGDPKYTKTEEVKGRWGYVERLFPKLRIPPPLNATSPTGWRAPAEQVPDLPYFVERSKNHMLPVYENRVYKDRVLVTQVDTVKGDIWVFEQDLKQFLQKELGKKVETHVNEIACFVNVKGSHVELIKGWLYDKGF